MLSKGDIFRNYKLENWLGKGQFGEVWLAEKQTELSSKKFRHVLKFIPNNRESLDLISVKREIDNWIEASGHPNIVPVLDSFIFEHYFIIVSEYANGGTLERWIENKTKPISHIEVLQMISGILSGIEHLHSQLLIHRDLKPANILIQSNQPRITDFGISRISTNLKEKTTAGGSPIYMAPEAWEGDKNPQTDIWSVGVIFYQMLMGKMPFEAKGETYIEIMLSLLTAINKGINPLSNQIPWEIQYIVNKALQKDVNERYKTANEMKKAVEKVLHKLFIESTNDIFKSINNSNKENKHFDGFSTIKLAENNVGFNETETLENEKETLFIEKTRGFEETFNLIDQQNTENNFAHSNFQNNTSQDIQNTIKNDYPIIVKFENPTQNEELNQRLFKLRERAKLINLQISDNFIPTKDSINKLEKKITREENERKKVSLADQINKIIWKHKSKKNNPK